MLPPSPARATWLVRNLARLREAGAVPVSRWTLPTRAFFPEGFDASRSGLDALARRLTDIAGLSFLEVRVALCDPETGEVIEDATRGCDDGPGRGGGCGACAPSQAPSSTATEAADDGPNAYRLDLALDAAKTPAIAAARLARAVGAVFLAESDLAPTIPKAERVAVSELAAISIGFAALVLPAAAWTVRGCGGARVLKATALEVGDLAIATELVGESTGFDTHGLHGSLDDVVRAELGAARRLVAENRGVARALRDDPGSLLDGIVQLRPRKTLGARLRSLFGQRSIDDEIDALEAELAGANGANGAIGPKTMASKVP